MRNKVLDEQVAKTYQEYKYAETSLMYELESARILHKYNESALSSYLHELVGGDGDDCDELAAKCIDRHKNR